MEIEFQQTVTKRVKETIKIECPSFFKTKNDNFIAVYSPQKMTCVKVGSYYTGVTSGQPDVIGHYAEDIEYIITEQVFNEILEQAKVKILSGTEIHPEPQIAHV